MSSRRIDRRRNPELSLKLSGAPVVVDGEFPKIDDPCGNLGDSVKIRISIKMPLIWGRGRGGAIATPPSPGNRLIPQPNPELRPAIREMELLR